MVETRPLLELSNSSKLADSALCYRTLGFFRDAMVQQLDRASSQHELAFSWATCCSPAQPKRQSTAMLFTARWPAPCVQYPAQLR